MDDGRHTALTATPVLADDEPTRDFGPRPPWRVDPRAPAARRRLLRAPRRTVLLGAAAVLMVAGAAVGASAAIGAPRRDCPRRAAPATLPGGTVLHGDVDGDGCADLVLERDGVLVVPAGVLASSVVRFRLDSSAVIVLGDWDCDHVDTPAEYEAATGVVTYFDEWPLANSPAVPSGTAIARRRGTAAVARAPGRCDRVIVT